MISVPIIISVIPKKEGYKHGTGERRWQWPTHLHQC
jgi:hypothetical protein